MVQALWTSIGSVSLIGDSSISACHPLPLELAQPDLLGDLHRLPGLLTGLRGRRAAKHDGDAAGAALDVFQRLAVVGCEREQPARRR